MRRDFRALYRKADIELRPVPAHPAARRERERKASPIAAYREMYGYDHPQPRSGSLLASALAPPGVLEQF
jgi:hypothetical protein